MEHDYYTNCRKAELNNFMLLMLRTIKPNLINMSFDSLWIHVRLIYLSEMNT